VRPVATSLRPLREPLGHSQAPLGCAVRAQGHECVAEVRLTGSPSMIRERSYCLDLDESARSCWSDSKDSDGRAAVAPYRAGCGVG
jgi:hypothetical protein